MPLEVARHCPACRVGVSASLAFCTRCGLQLRPTCEDCGKPWSRGDEFCGDCGQVLDLPPTLAEVRNAGS